MKLILLGAPGAGKGTQSDFIKDALKVPVISTGNLLREAIALGTDLGKQAKAYMDGGNLVPDELIIGLVKEKLESHDCDNGAIFLAIIAALPLILSNIPALGALGIGGTTTLIMVSVSLETVRAIEGELMMRHYKGFLE